MGRKKRRKAEARSAGPAPGGGGRLRVALLLAVVVAAAALAVATWRGGAPSDEGVPPATTTRSARPDAAPSRPRGGPAPGEGAEAPTRFRPLLGEWVRPDGGYVLSVTGIGEDGQATVGYFNPRSINVERAEAREEEGQVGLFVQLRDRGYPGSTYTLVHDPRGDQLKGLYFQAAQQATYDVVFVRR